MCCLQPPLGPPLVLPETLLWVPGALPISSPILKPVPAPRSHCQLQTGIPQFSIAQHSSSAVCLESQPVCPLPLLPKLLEPTHQHPTGFNMSLFEKPFPSPHGCLPLPLLLQGQSASKGLLLSDPLSALSSLQCVSGQSHSHHNAKSKDWASPVPHSTCLLVLTAPPPPLTSPPSTPTSLSCLPNHRLLCLCPSFKL